MHFTGANSLVSTAPIDVESRNSIEVASTVNATNQTVRLLANADGTDAEGTISPGAANNSFLMQPGSSILTTNDTAEAVTIFVNTLLGGTGNATLTSISAGTTNGRVTVDAVAGSIVDGNAASNNITAAEAVLLATAGVGSSADPIETTVAGLAGSGGSGGFFVANSGNLTISEFGTTAGVSTTTGNIDVRANGSLTVMKNVGSQNATGNILLKANENFGKGRDRE